MGEFWVLIAGGDLDAAAKRLGGLGGHLPQRLESRDEDDPRERLRICFEAEDEDEVEGLIMVARLPEGCETLSISDYPI